MLKNFDLPSFVDFLLMCREKSQLFGGMTMHFTDVSVDFFLPHKQKVNKIW
jgi:hypothetical protein